MKAAIVYSAGKLPEFGDFIEPPVDADHVMINVKAAAVSQLVKSRSAGTHYSSKMQYPFIAGICHYRCKTDPSADVNLTHPG